jgi:hypothetical protein
MRTSIDNDEFNPSVYTSLVQRAIEDLWIHDIDTARAIFDSTSKHHEALFEMGFDHEDIFFSCLNGGVYNIINLKDDEIVQLLARGFCHYEIVVLSSNIQNILWVLNSPDYLKLLCRGYCQGQITSMKLCDEVLDSVLSITDDEFLDLIRMGKSRDEIFEFAHFNK